MHLIKISERRVESLLNQTLQAHELVVSLLSTPNLANALTALYDDDVRSDATESPTDTARRAGLNLPDGSNAYIHEFADGWEVEVHIPQGRGLVIVGYSSIRGFYTK